jgi:hypothetical protein
MLYKLTNQDMQTYGGFQWKIGEAAPRLSGKGELCSAVYYHAYKHPELAIVFNPIHAAFAKPCLFEARGRVAKDDGLKVGCRTLTLVKELEIPSLSNETLVTFAILCVKEVNNNSQWNIWADAWLSGEDRSEEAAAEAAEAAAWAAEAAARAAEAAAGAAAWAAREAATAAATAAEAAAAEAAARVARAVNLDLVVILNEAKRRTKGR